MPVKLTYEQVVITINYAAPGYILLDNEYINSKHKMTFRCPNGHKFKMEWRSFNRGHRCKRCIGRDKTIKDIMFEVRRIANGYAVLSDEYVNNQTKLKFECNRGHRFNMTWNSFQQGKRCSICYHEKCTTKDNLPRFDTYVKQISFANETRRNLDDNRLLEVKCHKCRKWFTPKMTEVKSRINALKGIVSGECNLYCSDECRTNCATYNRVSYQIGHPHNDDIDRPYQREWANAVKENAEHECERCGSVENLVAHHIKPVKTHPHLQADLDNGICVCRKCDKKFFHQLDGCKTDELARMVC